MMNQLKKPLRCWVEIEKKVISNNIQLLKKQLNTKTALLVVVKGNGYGYGIVESSILAIENGANFLGVAYVEEAIKLRHAGIKIPILLLSEPSYGEISDILTHDITPTIYTYEFAKRINNVITAMKKSINIHLKIDTGLNRLGMKNKDVIDTVVKINALPSIHIQGVYSHFASASSNTVTYTKKQYECFLHIISQLQEVRITPKYLHIANSSSLVWYPMSQLNMVRLGMAVFGLQPSMEKPYPLPIKSGLSWKTKVLQVKSVEKNEYVGYDNAWIAKKNTKIASIAIGYADGFRQGPKNFGYVLCGGKRAKVIGRVTMSIAIIEIGAESTTQIGDEVVIIGSQGNYMITPEDVATQIGSSNEEVLTNINPSIPRIYFE